MIEDKNPRRATLSELPRDVWILTLNAFFVAVGFGVMVPVLPVLARQFEATTFMVSWVISSFALMRLLISPFCGRIVDRLGERTTLVTGVLFVSLTSAAAGLSESFWQLLLFRAVGGLGSAMFTVSAMTLLLRSVPARLRGRASGYYQGGFLLGNMVGPALGGLVTAISVRAPFFFYAITLAVGGVLSLLLLSSKPRSDLPDKAEAPRRSLASLFADVRFQSATAVGFAQGWGAMGARMAFLPILVTESLLLAPEWTGYVFLVGSISQTLMVPLAGRWTDEIGRRPVIVVGGLITGLTLVAMPFSPNVWVLMAVSLAFGVGGSLLGSGPAATVGDVAEGRGGTPIAVYSMTTDLGVIVGPLVAGAAADAFGLDIAFWMGGVLLVAAALSALRMPPHRPAAEDAEPARA